ncbi:MAG: CRTAC1 family protein [Planctomycetaceae bacterium]
MPARLAYPALVLLLVAPAAWFLSGCSEESQPAPPEPGQSALAPPPPALAPPAETEEEWFVDEAAARGITLLNQTGEPRNKELIMGTVGPGCAWFDANGDGLLDLYIVNGTWLVGGRREEVYSGPDRPRNALYMQQPDGTFRDEARARGVDDDAWGFGACAFDFDNDGDQDLYVANLGPNRLYRNDGQGGFVDIAAEAGVAGVKADWSTGAAVGDYDRDGLLDLYVSNYADMFLWLREAGQVRRDEQGNVTDARTCEWQRLRVYCGPVGLPKQQHYLFRNLGKGRFEDVTKSSRVWRPEAEGGPEYGFQPLFTDLNKDGWPDIYVANDSVPAFFFENQRDGTFRECAAAYGIQLSSTGAEMAGMGADSCDINEDGWPDLHKTNFADDTNSLYIAEPVQGMPLTFRDHSDRAGIRQVVYKDLAWGVLVFDYDHDGDRDLFYANGHVYPEVDGVEGLNMKFEQTNRLLRNDSTRRAGGGVRLAFKDVSATSGPGMRIEKCSRGAAMADFDNDGDLDILVVNLNDKPNLLVNRLGQSRGHWLTIRLRGDPARGTNRDAVGAKLWIDDGRRRQYVETLRGQSFLSCNDPRVHVGLGAGAGPIRIEIVWPDAAQSRSSHTVETGDREILIEQP